MNKLAQSVGLQPEPFLPEHYKGCHGEAVKESNRLIPVKDWPKLYVYPTERMLRHLIFNAETNGFNQVIRRIGTKIAIHEGCFFRWLEAQNNVK